MAASIPVWCGPFQYCPHHTSMVGALPVTLSDWFGPHHTGMVPTIPVWPPAYWYGEGHTGVAHIIPVYWRPYRLHCWTSMAGLVLPSDKNSQNNDKKKLVGAQFLTIFIKRKWCFPNIVP